MDRPLEDDLPAPVGKDETIFIKYILKPQPLSTGKYMLTLTPGTDFKVIIQASLNKFLSAKSKSEYSTLMTAFICTLLFPQHQSPNWLMPLAYLTRYFFVCELTNPVGVLA